MGFIQEGDYDAVLTPKPAEHDNADVFPSSPMHQSGSMVPLLQLFRFADSIDVALMVVGALSAFATGAAIPLRILLFGNVVSALNPTEGSNLLAEVASISLKLVWMGLGATVTGFLQVMCWSITASRQSQRMREAYTRAILTKEVAWFDMNDPASLATKVASTSMLIQDGLGRQVGDACNFFAMAVAGVAVGLGAGWKLGIVVLAFTPLIAIGTYFMMKSMAKAVQESVAAYGQAGSVAEEALSNIRTIHTFNAVPATAEKYNVALAAAEAAGIRKGLVAGLGNGLVYFVLFLTYVVGIYYGAIVVANDNIVNQCKGPGCYDGGKVLTVFFGIITGAVSMGQAGPCIEAIVSARSAAFEAYKIIDEPSLIDPMSTEGMTLDHVDGAIELDQVVFHYPSRPQVQVCQGYTLRIAAGEKVALVGPSGSGKSTIVSLLERFYDPIAGTVTLDGVNLRELNVSWLRQQIGLVGQEPCLFADSIAANIRHGKPDATMEEVEAAAKMANAYDFIVTFPHGFNTAVGERGAQLSGGQKQRIAIARAIIKNPAVLLLDEATSALDTESERVVQESLDRLVAARQRTTIMIAHRLSTIRNADRIVVLNHGKVIEQGPHDVLMQLPRGHYKRLVDAQVHGLSIDAVDLDVDDDSPMMLGAVNVDVSTAAVVAGGRPSPTSRSSRTSRASRHSVKSLLANPQDDGSAVDSNDDAATKQMDVDESVYAVPMRRLWHLSQPEFKYILSGSIGAMITGATFPLWGVLLSKSIALFFKFSLTADEMKHEGLIWAMAFLALGTLYCAAAIVQNYSFSVVSERMTTRLRGLGFAAMLRQDMAWHDVNPSGVLTTRLATEATLVQSMTAEFLKNTLSTLVMLSVAFGISLYYSWQLALTMIVLFPMMAMATSLRSKAFSGPPAKAAALQGDMLAGALLAESINAIRTIASFGMEHAVKTAVAGYIRQSKAEDGAQARRLGVVYGFSQGIMFFAVAFLFWFGGWLIEHTYINFEAMFMVVMALMLSSFGIGTALQSLASQDKAKRATGRLFETMDRVPAIDCTATAGGATLDNVAGVLEFRHVRFAYPSRPHTAVYKDYSLTIPSGSTVALVGASGSGKSTAIGLLERFYDPVEGSILLDGIDLRSLNLHWLRDHISLVGQEPVLFAGSIADNIRTGKPSATSEEVVAAAKMANAHDFILRFPNGYDTHVGDRGVQVSGGQKQRVAIARAILRDPAVLLLDEATSALDNESERIVQRSLDALLTLKKRTTIIVAHRLSTIRHADLIAVCADGGIVELGTHDDLIKLPNGVYQTLVSRQVAATAATSNEKK
ncbi:hypothetical protein DYB32_006852 [Aphanomyces invadans]|uniref:Uncharacterized protein n=1 Tax=Aphanomyces invadans TaxID=157072 RepID=A0A3R6Z193_9STRA|nr:hypothetical protein DYB32_006852 [Aphanomyces invadans]